MEEDNSHKYQRYVLKNIFLLSLLTIGNYVVPLLGCQLQNFLTLNIYAKHLIMLFIIYLTLTTNSNNTKRHPLLFVRDTVIIWICFMLFSRQNLNYSLMTLLLLGFAYIADQYASYYTEMENKDALDFSHRIRNLLCGASVATLIIGFFMYFTEKRKEYDSNFDLSVFFFGKTYCDSMKQ